MHNWRTILSWDLSKQRDRRDFKRSKAKNLDEMGKEFATLVKKECTREEWAEIVRRNAAEENPDICHSHDFMDTNVVMEYYIENILHVTMWDNQGNMKENVMDLWDNIWEHATPWLAGIEPL